MKTKTKPTQHTPGPWKADSATHRGCTYIQQPNEGENGGWVVATCWGADRETNARLIAAAPDMLSALYASEIALRSCLRQNVQVDAAFEQVRKAIVKATGTEAEAAK